MDAPRFDAWTRTRATGANRRSFLGWSLSAGLAAVFSRLAPAAAQFGAGGSCTYSVALTSSLASSGSISGTLVLDIGDGGAIDSGTLTLTGQSPAPVVGQATGPAIALLASLPDGTSVSLTGVASGPIAGCSAPVAGVLANPDTHQLGTWQAQPGGSGQPSAPPPADSGRSVPTETGSSSQPPTTCDPPKMVCGSACCPAGADCYDASTGGCACPDGTEECDIACFPSCADGAPLDPITCLCPTG